MFELELQIRKRPSVSFFEFLHFRNSRIKIIYGLLFRLTIPGKPETIVVRGHIGGIESVRAYFYYHFFGFHILCITMQHLIFSQYLLMFPKPLLLQYGVVSENVFV